LSEQSVRAQDIVEECRRRGYLARQLYMVSTRPVNGIGPVMANLDIHLSFQEELERDGIMFAAGPNWTDDEQAWEGDGTVVIRAASLINGARTFTVRPWLVNEGTITVQLGLATGRFKLI
jgi:hypothetical protein